MTKPFHVLFSLWLLGGFGAVGASILGSAFGQAGLMTGAVLGGAAATAAGVYLAVRLGWLPAESRRGSMIGGLAGFAVAAVVAVTNLHGPVIPVLSSGLIGTGVLIGSGVARGIGGG
jgi:hypothetical protein